MGVSARFKSFAAATTDDCSGIFVVRTWGTSCRMFIGESGQEKDSLPD